MTGRRLVGSPSVKIPQQARHRHQTESRQARNTHQAAKTGHMTNISHCRHHQRKRAATGSRRKTARDRAARVTAGRAAVTSTATATRTETRTGTGSGTRTGTDIASTARTARAHQASIQVVITVKSALLQTVAVDNTTRTVPRAIQLQIPLPVLSQKGNLKLLPNQS